MKKYYNDKITFIKKIFYGKQGEPFRIRDKTLYYIPGTRPARFKYINSNEITVRNDVKQMKYFIDKIKTGDFVLDIGGHTGQYAVLFAALVSNSGKVVTFEPDKDAIKVLYQNLRINNLIDFVIVEDIALSDVNGAHSFFTRGGDSMSSLKKSGLGSNALLNDFQEYSVETMKLDDYLKMHKRGFPDWIKIDTEGAEISILKGAKEVLESKAIIVCEMHPYAWDEFGVKYSDLMDLVRQSGRNIKYFDDSLKLEDGPHYGAVLIS